jgi:hypothetical protein
MPATMSTTPKKPNNAVNPPNALVKVKYSNNAPMMIKSNPNNRSNSETQNVSPSSLIASFSSCVFSCNVFL